MEEIAAKKRRSRSGDYKNAVKLQEEETPHHDHHQDHDDDQDDKEEEESEEKKNCRRKFDHGYDVVKGKMGHGLEDYIVAETRSINGHFLGLYAIFDGHSGRDVADYLQNHLFDNILTQPDFWKDTKKAIKRAYKSTENHILRNVVGRRGGSTAVTAIIIDGKKLVVANVGDSRAILCNNKGEVKQVTVDHEAEKEIEVVESKGGFVSKKLGNEPRVDGQLAMSRAFGDGSLKEHISVNPDVKMVEIGDDVEFLILASDGLWKVMGNEEVWDEIEEKKNAEEVAKMLISEALKRGSKDDISCVCYFLRLVYIYTKCFSLLVIRLYDQFNNQIVV